MGMGTVLLQGMMYSTEVRKYKLGFLFLLYSDRKK